jgi:hypothetical protein
MQIQCYTCCCSEWLDPYNNYVEDLEHPEVYDDAWRKFNQFNMCKDFMRQVGVKLTWMVCLLLEIASVHTTAVGSMCAALTASNADFTALRATVSSYCTFS